jgi:hypothetical protein
MTKLIEYLEIAKKCNYIRPDKSFDQWTDVDYYFDSFYITLNTVTQSHALVIMCNQNTFTSTYFKRMAKEYIARFS